jgi:hypothetical protein
VTVAEDGKKTYSAKQVATRIGTDAKQLRKFFRDPKSGYDAVGQGGRYDFPEADVAEIKKAFDAWEATKTRRNRTPQSPEAKLASASGLIPRQRKESAGEARAPRPKSPAAMAREGLHGNALDEDTLEDRMQGIAARVKKHNLVPKGGRLVPGPRRTKTDEGLTTPPTPETLDFSEEEPDEDELLADELTPEDFDNLLDELGEFEEDDDIAEI